MKPVRLEDRIGWRPSCQVIEKDEIGLRINQLHRQVDKSGEKISIKVYGIVHTAIQRAVIDSTHAIRNMMKPLEL